MRKPQELNSLALKTRREWGEDGYAPIDIFAIVNRLRDDKITVLKYPLSNRISGMCTKVDDDIVICVNSTTSYGRQRFTLAHELYHALYEEFDGQVICNVTISDEQTDSEREADMFASYLLMPYDALFQFSENYGEEWSLRKVIDAEQFFQVSHMAILYRLETERFISHEEAMEYNDVTISREAALCGYGKELYQPSPDTKKYFTTGEYIRKIENLAKEELISEGKKEEMLLDGYRADIVYNLDEEEGNLND